MDLTNKDISIKYLTVDNVAQTTSANVEVSSEIAEGVFQIEGTYQINFDVAYNNMGDPNLMPAIIEKLESLP